MINNVQMDRRGSVEHLKPAPSYNYPVTFKYEIQHHTTRMQKLTTAFKVYRLTVSMLICVVVGLTIGLIIHPHTSNWSERQFMYIELPGELYLRFLKLMVIPILASNVILSFGTIEGKLSSRLGKSACFLYLILNTLAITIAIIVALLMCPGIEKPLDSLEPSEEIIRINSKIHLNEYHDSIKHYREYHPMFYQIQQEAKSDEALLVHRQYEIEPLKLVMEKIEGTIKLTSTSVDEKDQTVLNYEINPESAQENVKNPSRVVSRLKLAIDTPNMQTKNTTIRYGTKMPIDVILDILRNLIPDSIIGATIRQTRTRLFAPKQLIISKNGSTEPPPPRWTLGYETVDQPNIIGLLAISVLTGVVLSHMKEANRPLLNLCSCISELSIRIAMKAINLTPYCIMFLIIGQVARSKNLSSTAGELLMYSITVIIALCIHGLVVLPLIYHAVTKKSPIKFAISVLDALVASFATSSSSATMALLLDCLAETDLNPVIVRAFGPLGSVFSMNGTAIYEVVATIFIAQTVGVALPLSSILLIALASAVASLSTTGIPSSGMMTMVIVLDSVNLPVLQLSLIYIVDFIIDRFRTVLNVWSGAVICGLINHIYPEQLFEEEMKPGDYSKMVKYRGSRGNNVRKLSENEESQEPQVISVTITPPAENSKM